MTKKEIMKNVDCTKSRLVGNNTVEYFRSDGTKVIRLHRTDIVTFNNDGSIMLNSGGWKTVTTKSRMNDHLSHGWYLYQRDYAWYLSNQDEVYDYYDGIVIK